jgi:hypothetical protein
MFHTTAYWTDPDAPEEQRRFRRAFNEIGRRQLERKG